MTRLVAKQIALLVVLGATAAGAQEPEWAAALSAELERAAALGFAGQVLVAVDGRVVFNAAYGVADRRSGRRFGTSTPTGIGSVTKMLTAVAVLQLAEEGRIAVSDSVGAWFDDLPAPVRGIRIHELLTHTSGLPGGYLAAAGDTSVVAAARRALEVRRDTAMLGRWRYSSEGYLILAAIVERASGLPWEAYLRERILLPAGMLTAATLHRPSAAAARAYIHTRDATRDDVQWALAGAGDVVASAEDLFHFARALRGGVLLSTSSWAALRAARAAIADGYAAGYGAFVRARGATPPAVEHGGDDLTGYAAFLGIFFEPDITLVITSNARDYQGRWWRRALGDRIERLIFGSDHSDTQPPLTPVADSLIQRAVGSYAAGNGQLHLVDGGGTFFMTAYGQDAVDAVLGESNAAARQLTAGLEILCDSLLRHRIEPGFSAVTSGPSVGALTAWWSGMSDRMGVLTAARVGGSVTSGAEVAGTVTFRFTGGEETVRFVTDTAGALRRVDPDRVSEWPLAFPVAAEPDGTWRAEDPHTGRAIRFRWTTEGLELLHTAPIFARRIGVMRRSFRP